MQLARLARDQNRVSLKLLNLEMWPRSLVKTNGMEPSVSNFPGNDNIAEIGA